MTTNENGWGEADSLLYQEIAQVAVPARVEQIATLLSLLPFAPPTPFRAVEVGCGQGMLSESLLCCFPEASLVALDGSEAMRAVTQARLAPYGSRTKVAAFDLFETDWLTYIEGVDVVLSSLCIHHLSGPDKQQLFAAIAARLSSSGVFLNADLVEPQRTEARELFAATWERITQAQAMVQAGSPQLYEKFVEHEWNYYRFDDPADRPSGLFEQLVWLKAAGFASVDCFWLQAGHAIYGGYKISASVEGGLTFETALKVAEKVSRG